jgi:beta-lactam-binding protein with PASTA domain
MQLIDKLLKKPFWFNVLVGLLALLFVFVIFFFSLGWITNNGATSKVPNVVGLDVFTAQKNLTNLGFTVVLQDSIYVDTLARNGVLRQTPDADEVVKKGRTVYLTINRFLAPQIEMPNLIGFSLQSAETYLSVLGLRLGTITLVPDKNKNVIVEQLFNGSNIEPGKKIPSGTIIHFLVGSGVVSETIEVPDLIGMTLPMAQEKILSLGLTIGNFSSNEFIQDSANSFVIGQDPDPYLMQLDTAGLPIKNKIFKGDPIHLMIDKKAPISIKADSIH